MFVVCYFFVGLMSFSLACVMLFVFLFSWHDCVAVYLVCCLFVLPVLCCLPFLLFAVVVVFLLMACLSVG